jgi:hypothetical protein
MPPADTWKVFPVDTDRGAPVQVPNIHRTGAPAWSHSSMPLMVQVDPLFVHDRVDVFAAVPELAAANAHADPAVTYPEPLGMEVWVPEAPGVLDPSRTLIPVVEAVLVCRKMAFSSALAALASRAGIYSAFTWMLPGTTLMVIGRQMVPVASADCPW